MEKESLEKVQIELIKALKTIDINGIDKLELMVNINNFLEYEDYDENIQILRKNKEKKRRGSKID